MTGRAAHERRENFQRHRCAPLVFQAIIYSNDVVTMTWSAIAGQTYRVLYEEDLNNTNWKDLSPDVTAVRNRKQRRFNHLRRATVYRILVR